MPLLKKKTLERAPMPEYLRDDEEVFVCEMTNEIFRDYSEFAERTILCNSMVWTCSMTGKMNMTYEEALTSEKNAKKMLQDFPEELKVPMLYTANVTHRTTFSEMADDVYMYIKDRYFVGEMVEACFAANKWKFYKVVQVIAPTAEEIKQHPNYTATQLNPPPELYKYDLEHTNSEDSDITEKLMVNMNQMRRRKTTYSRDRSKLFLKQYVAQNADSYFIIKPSSLKNFNITKETFSKIFSGPEPAFPKSPMGKKVRQETLAKFLTKNNLLDHPVDTKKKIPVEPKKKISVEPKKKIPAKPLDQVKKKVVTAEEKQKKRIDLNNRLKEWYVVKDDLILEDHKVLPEPVPMVTKIPKDLLGDVLCVLEFIENFSSVLLTKNYFSEGLTFDIMEKALIEKKACGPLISIFEMLLDAIFSFQEEDCKKLELETISKQESRELQETTDIGYEEIIQASTLVIKFVKRFHGIWPRKLPICPITISEVLRLHILTSPARYTDSHSSRVRSINRGGYGSQDDPAIEFRLKNTHILRALTIHNVTALSVRDKLKLLNCLVDQLLTYRNIRDVATERRESCWDMNKAINKFKANLKKMADQEKEAKNNTEKVSGSATVNEVQKKITRERIKSEKEISATEGIIDLNKKIHADTTLIGYDRAFRRYLKLSSVPGLFVNNEDPNSGQCLVDPVYNVPEVSTGDRRAVTEYLRKLTEELNLSDKENEPKEEDDKNALQNGIESNNKNIAKLNTLYMCSTDPTTCIVHSVKPVENPWMLFSKESDLTELISCLNPRGVREVDLKRQLENGHEVYTKIIKSTPEYLLDNSIRKPVELRKNQRDENFGFPDDTPMEDILYMTALETILDFENKLYRNGIGGFPAAERNSWKSYLKDEKFDKILINFKNAEIERKNFIKSKEDTHDNEVDEEYKDPLDFLKLSSATIDIDETVCDFDDIVLFLTETEEKRLSVLAKTIIYLAHSIKSRCLFLPLGTKIKKGDSFGTVKNSIMGNWEKSLLKATSYAIISVHLTTLKSCVGWSSVNVTCILCSKKTFQNMMAVCENCSEGVHIFCTKPKMKNVPEEKWYCQPCLNTDVDSEEEEEDVSFSYDPVTDPKNCTTCGEVECGEVVRCNHCPLIFHLECVIPPLRRVPRTYKCKNCLDKEEEEEKAAAVSDENVRRSNRVRDEAKNGLPLHNVELQEILAEVLKHEDAWPFISPVQKREVPDYYDVISNPMDFGTIRYKLNMGDYKYDEEIFSDIRLVFENCNTYNSSADDVFKCGVRLLNFILKQLKDVDLKTHILSDIELLHVEDTEEEPKIKKKRMQ